MSERIPASKLPEFYKTFSETKPSLVLGLIIISFGFYIINWIYTKNREFEILSEFAPDANRGAIIMMIIPFFWFFFIKVLQNLIFSSNNLIIGILEIVGFGIILFLLLKYLFDFCLTFGEITKSPGIIWFIPFIIGIIGIIGTFFKFFYLSPLFLFLIIVIPAMQAELNKNFHKLSMKKQDINFYH